MTDYIGLGTTITTRALLGDDGLWRIRVVMSQTRSSDLIDWEKKEVAFNSIHKDYGKAIAESQLTLASYLDKVGHTLFTEESEKKDGSAVSQQDT